MAVSNGGRGLVGASLGRVLIIRGGGYCVLWDLLLYIIVIIIVISADPAGVHGV